MGGMQKEGVKMCGWGYRDWRRGGEGGECRW